jgi:hypothetical protein
MINNKNNTPFHFREGNKNSFVDTLKLNFSFSKLSSLFILFFALLFLSETYSQKTYSKTYYDNGNMKAEGWMLESKKIDYWFFYRKDATKEKEGHYVNGNKESWWIFYNELEEISQKCQFKKNKKNGYCLVYKNNNLNKACKFKDGKLIKEWEDYASFRKENNLSDLRQ